MSEGSNEELVLAKQLLEISRETETSDFIVDWVYSYAEKRRIHSWESYIPKARAMILFLKNNQTVSREELIDLYTALNRK